MFSVNQKRQISEAIQKVLRDTNHPELPETEISFHLNVKGAEAWSWADIQNNGAVSDPSVNPHNERMDSNANGGQPAAPSTVSNERFAYSSITYLYMTKREAFAMAAMQGFATGHSGRFDTPAKMAECAALWADTLLEELEK